MRIARFLELLSLSARQKVHRDVALPLEASAQRDVGGRERSVDDLLDHIHPLLAVLRRCRREVVDALGCEEAEAESLILKLPGHSAPHVVPAGAVPDEDLALREPVEDVVVVHQLPAVQRAPSTTVSIRRPRPRLHQISFLGEVLRQHRNQIRLVGARVSDLQVVKLRAADRLVPIHDDLRVVVVHEEMTRRVSGAEVSELETIAVHHVGLELPREYHVELGNSQNCFRAFLFLHVVPHRVVRLVHHELPRVVFVVLLALLHQVVLHAAEREARHLARVRELPPLVLRPYELL